MARPNQEAIETFISVTGLPEAVAVEKLEGHGGDLNAAVNAHFNEGDRIIGHGTSITAPQDDLMETDDDPISTGPARPPLSLLSGAGAVNPYSLLDPNFSRSLFDPGSNFVNSEQFVRHPMEAREIPTEIKDADESSRRMGHTPIIEDVTDTDRAHGQDVHGRVIIDGEDNENAPAVPNPLVASQNGPQGDSSHDTHIRPSVPEFDRYPDYGNDIEEEMIRAAIEASKQEVQDLDDFGPPQGQSHLDSDLEHAVSLSLKTAERENSLHELGGEAGAAEGETSNPAEVELDKIAVSNGRMETGSSFIPDEVENVKEQPLVMNRSGRIPSGLVESSKEVAVVEASSPSSPGLHDTDYHSQRNGDAFPSDEWGGISSVEHDEAVMLEAAMFGGIPEGTGYNFPYATHEFMQASRPYPRPVPRPPSPSLEALRLIREQQDDEYLASLQADREKALKAMEEAEARRLQEEVARKAAIEEEKQREEESRRMLEEEQELERILAAKEASLPKEPLLEDENAITLLVRMPDGSRRGRCFLKSDKLQVLFDFIDIGRGVKPGTYRLVRPYPRRAFSDGESALTLNELGLTSKQEALFLELI
ncbi:plant UBX domain-containing protein 8-like [Tripterygium wilfordii]|uniref:plant UBX domain-containing protein 8-like n=1 Tax=Tripterygium wilfordii TaxID=458696 RepID=UPI0018F8078F|nr:plant UBX domain-containing protein 8-like [Tripterygium wilfordii]